MSGICAYSCYNSEGNSSDEALSEAYSNARIEIKGYENTNFQNNSFDLAIGNVPFGQYKVFDPAYNKLVFSIHNYFFAKAIDQVSGSSPSRNCLIGSIRTITKTDTRSTATISGTQKWCWG